MGWGEAWVGGGQARVVRALRVLWGWSLRNGQGRDNGRAGRRRAGRGLAKGRPLTGRTERE